MGGNSINLGIHVIYNWKKLLFRIFESDSCLSIMSIRVNGPQELISFFIIGNIYIYRKACHPCLGSINSILVFQRIRRHDSKFVTLLISPQWRDESSESGESRWKRLTSLVHTLPFLLSTNKFFAALSSPSSLISTLLLSPTNSIRFS